jgi:hypothetical protein
MDGTSPEGKPEENSGPATAAPEANPVSSDTLSRKPRWAVALAGLQAGMVGVLWMLAWLGLSAVWQKDSFWKPENLFATAFYGGDAYRAGFVHTTFAGLSLYLLIYSTLGALFAVAVRGRLRPSFTLLASVLLGAAWYYLSFRLWWKSVIPLAYLWHAETPTLIGHLLYGTFLSRFEVYLREPRRPVAMPPAPAAEPVTVELPMEIPVAVPAADDSMDSIAAAPEEVTPAPDQSSLPPDRV